MPYSFVQFRQHALIKAKQIHNKHSLLPINNNRSPDHPNSGYIPEFSCPNIQRTRVPVVYPQ